MEKKHQKKRVKNKKKSIPDKREDSFDFRADQKRHWYQKTGWILFWLLIFFPAGVVLMWKNKRWNKLVKILLSGFFGFWFLTICVGLTTPTKLPDKILLSADSEQVYDINSEVDIELKTTPEDCYIPQSAFEMSGGEINFKNDTITFTSSKDGEFDIYVKYSDITSNRITLKFEDKKAIEQAERERLAAEQAEQERLAAEQAEQERLAAEQAERERLAAEQVEQERLAAEQAERERLAAERAEQERIAAEQARIAQGQSQQTTASIGEMVWLSETGSKYHNKPNCGNMNPNKARQVPLAEAQQNYGACKNCYR